MWTGWHPYPVHKFTNRMRSTHHPSGLQFFYLMTTRWGGVQFTTYKPDDTPHPVHPVNNLWTGRQAVRFSNFKKWESDGLIRVHYQKLQSCLIKEGYLGNFFKSSCGIKILYGGAGREYGGGGRICLNFFYIMHGSSPHIMHLFSIFFSLCMGLARAYSFFFWLILSPP